MIKKTVLIILQVEYSTTLEELQALFQSCGAINRITIPSDKFGRPKGFAYIEFAEQSSVPNARVMSGSILHDRVIEV
jgi:polyadenylate-binding protein 2